MSQTVITLSRFRKMLWLTLDGRCVAVADLTDTHLANIIHHCKSTPGYPLLLINCFEREARSRKLTHAFLEQAPFPWQSDDGKWMQFNAMDNSYEVIGR